MPAAEDKLYSLLDSIIELQALTPRGEPVSIHLEKTLHNALTADELEQALRLLAGKQIIRPAATPNNDNRYEVIVTATKRQIKSKFPGYLQHRLRTAMPVLASPQSDEIAYTITYDTHTHEILLNGLLLAKPDFDSENEIFFTYMYAHPNEKVTIEDIKKQTGASLKKPIHRVIADLGFSGDIRKAFFTVSKGSALFRNRVTHGELRSAGIKRLYIEKKK